MINPKALINSAGKGSDKLPKEEEETKQERNKAVETELEDSMPNSQMMKEIRAKALKSKRK